MPNQWRLVGKFGCVAAHGSRCRPAATRPLLPRSPPNNGTVDGKPVYSTEASQNTSLVTAPFQ